MEVFYFQGLGVESLSRMQRKPENPSLCWKVAIVESGFVVAWFCCEIQRREDCLKPCPRELSASRSTSRWDPRLIFTFNLIAAWSLLSLPSYFNKEKKLSLFKKISWLFWVNLYNLGQFLHMCASHYLNGASQFRSKMFSKGSHGPRGDCERWLILEDLTGIVLCHEVSAWHPEATTKISESKSRKKTGLL